MARGNVRVRIEADASALKRETKQAERHLDGFGKAAGKLAALGGATLAVGGLADAFGQVMAEAQEARKVQAQTEAALKSTGMAAGVTARQVELLAQKLSMKTAIDDEQIQSAQNLLLTFTKISKETFPQATEAVLDLSVAMHTDLDSAAKLVGKALNDPVKGMTSLSRAGVQFTQQQKDQIKTLVESGRTLDAQKLILREFQTQMGGSARAAATPLDRMRVSVENLKERVGLELAPTVDRAARAITKFIDSLQGGPETSKRTSKAIKDITDGFRDFASAARSAERAVRPITSRVLPAVADAAKDVARVFRGLARTVKAVFDGDIKGALRGLGGTVKSALSYAVNVMKATTAPLRAAGAALGRAIVSGLKSALGAVGNLGSDIASGIINLLNRAVPDKIGPINLPDNPFGDGWGRKPFTGDGPGMARSASASLQGANPGLGHYASVGSRYGLRVSDGKRAAGTRTASGGVSYHGSGDAVDIAGSPAGMLAFAKHMANTYGSQLEELIYSPLGFSIKNGRKVAPYAVADHYDHVHVADTDPASGGPSGDGGGRRVVVRGRGSWFGGPRDSMDAGKTASGGTTATPGCAIRPGAHYNSGQPYLGGVWRITAPNGKTANVRQTDIGPHQRTGRRIDITYSALHLFGYNEKNFPTDAQFTAVYVGKNARTDKGRPMSGAFKMGSAVLRKSDTNRGVRNAVNASRMARTADGLDTALTLATTTPGLADDSAAATAGYNYWNTRVRQYAYGLKNGDKRVTGDMLADAIQKRDGFASANPLLASDVGGALRGDGTVSAGGSSDLAAAQASLAAEMKANRELAERIISTTGGQVIQGLIASMASTGIGTSFNLVNQAGGRGPGLHASY